MRKKPHVPSFVGLRPASAGSSRAKRANRATDTRAEVLLRKALHGRGLRFRKDVRDLPGRPDIVFVAARTVVFCDGDFWHGRNWRTLRRKLAKGANAEYWIQKIRANMERDQETNKHLADLGWSVIRVWETDVLTSPEVIAQAIARTIASRATSGHKSVAGRRKTEE